ncbi:MAG: 50S ribosomal protein L29 [Ardenticatenales bacterium]|nr:50S ribosomal protein L29 [Ardenticatenales bacterium]
MKATETRELKDSEIQQKLEEAYEELWNLRFKHATNQLTNTRDIRRIRKDIARLKTVQREREIWAAYEAQE